MEAIDNESQTFKPRGKVLWKLCTRFFDYFNFV